MNTVTEPYLSLSRDHRGGWSAWIEFPSDAMSHSHLVEVADRLIRDFGAVVTERYPDPFFEESKEYWWLTMGSHTVMLMRKPPDCPVGLCVEDGGVGVLVRIGRKWGIERYVGWRWKLWWAWQRLVPGRITEEEP